MQAPPIAQLENADITDAGEWKGTRMPAPTNASLSDCGRITDDGVTEVSRGCPHLQSLNLEECGKITDSGVTEVSRGCPHLKLLDLYWCDKITDSG